MGGESDKKDVVLVGAGIIGATFGALLHQLEPDWRITLYEQLSGPAEESSNEHNNSGTGHAALCELNYTVEQADGTIDMSKAVHINKQFSESRQFWSHLVSEGHISDPEAFIRTVPHYSFVQGKKNVDFLRRRFSALVDHPMFADMAFTDNPGEIADWLPLMMEGRVSDTDIAATKADTGTDVNFGELARKMLHYLSGQTNVQVKYFHKVKRIRQDEDGRWEIKVHDQLQNNLVYKYADFVFNGGGGQALPLLQSTQKEESQHLGGFPVSGQFLICERPEVVERHQAKVYGKEPEGAPPMTVPHLDQRRIDGKHVLLFGPFAGFTPKFLKTGSYLDLFASIKPNNLLTMAASGVKNASLVQYLATQLVMSQEDRMAALREFVPDAQSEDWYLHTAGQRVQLIEDNEDGRGSLQFGTKLIHSQDRTMASLLGESPGASTSVSAMLEALEVCFPERLADWQTKLEAMIPTYGQQPDDNLSLFQQVQQETTDTLHLQKECIKNSQ